MEEKNAYNFNEKPKVVEELIYYLNIAISLILITI